MGWTTKEQQVVKSNEIEMVNAIMRDPRIKLDADRPFLSVSVDLHYGEGGVQGFGGWMLGGAPGMRCGRHCEQPNLVADFIVRLLKIADVEEFSRMDGKVVRVKRSGFASATKIHAIGHCVEDIWLDPEEWFKEMRRGFRAVAPHAAFAQEPGE